MSEKLMSGFSGIQRRAMDEQMHQGRIYEQG